MLEGLPNQGGKESHAMSGKKTGMDLFIGLLVLGLFA